jgi:hypothetical protein
MFEDTKGVTRGSKSKKDRQYNVKGQLQIYKTLHKKKDWATIPFTNRGELVVMTYQGWKDEYY